MAGTVVLLPVAVFLLHAKVPRWIWLPIFVIGSLLALTLLLIFGALAVHWLLSLVGK